MFIYFSKNLFILALLSFAPVLFYGDEAQNAALRKVAHTQQNHETEISTIHQKMQTIDSSIDALREELTALIQATKTVTADGIQGTEKKAKSLEASIEKCVRDTHLLKDRTNELVECVQSFKKMAESAVESTKVHAKQIQDLESAMRSLVKAIDKAACRCCSTASGAKCSGPAIYRVQSGDSLGKIAKEQHSSISAIKEANNLRSDTIVPGQELQIP